MELAIVWKIVIALLIVAVAAALAHIVDLTRNKVKNSMSFRESMDLTGLPIVTFRQGENKYNFVLDTGAYSSLIDKNVLENMQYTELENSSVIYGVDGVRHTVNKVSIKLTYKGKEYEDEFKVMDMTSSFGSFKRDFGVTVHGLLSSAFFEKYKYVLDFKELIAYSK